MRSVYKYHKTKRLGEHSPPEENNVLIKKKKKNHPSNKEAFFEGQKFWNIGFEPD